MRKMKAIAVLEPGVVEMVDDVPIPEVGDYEALVQVACCGFCNGTDLRIIEGSMDFNHYPLVLGHEGSGEVVEIGKKVRNIAVGERFIHNNLHADAGNGYAKAHGGMAEYGLVVDHKAMLEDGYARADLEFYKKFARYPNDLSFLDGAMLLTLSECMSAVRNFGIRAGSEVLIYGAGPMGTAIAAYSKLAGAASVVLVSGTQSRLDYAKRVAGVEETINYNTDSVGEALGERRFDVAIDAVGRSSVILEASSFLKPFGILGALGVLHKNDRLLDLSKLQNNTRLQMLGFPYGEYDIMDENIELIRAGKIRPSDYYSHVLPMEQIQEARELVRSKQAMKVILQINPNMK